MYIPTHYREDDLKEIIAFIKKYNFATIISASENIPLATHLPFVVKENAGKITLISHFAKANPHWKNITSHKALVIFSEPHAYVSPKHYDSEINVPTWNYIAVHIYGKAILFEEADKAKEILEEMINSFEQEYFQQWKQLSPEYKAKMLNGIVAFEIEAEDIQAKKKLSQNKKPNEQQNIIKALEKSSHTTEQDIASYMKLNNEKRTKKDES